MDDFTTPLPQRSIWILGRVSSVYYLPPALPCQSKPPPSTLRGYFFRLIVTKITLLLKSVRVNRYSEEKSVKHQTRVEGLLHTPPNTQTHYTHTTHTHTHKDIIFLNTDPTIWDGSAGQNINSNKCHDTS